MTAEILKISAVRGHMKRDPRDIYSMGTRGQLTEAEQNRLIIENIGIIGPIAHKYRGGKVDFEELLAVGREGLVRAVRTYDPAKGDFLPRAISVIDSTLSHFVRPSERQWFPKDEISADQDDRDKIERIYEWDAWGDFGNSIAILESWTTVGASPEDLQLAYERIQSRKERFDAAFLSLSSVQKKLFRLCYMRDPRVEVCAAARELGISRYWASRSLKRALNTIRDVISRMDANQRVAASRPDVSRAPAKKHLASEHGR